MNHLIYDAILLVSAFLFAAAATGAAYGVLSRAGVMDIPNSRSNHARPVPRGGGLGLVFAMVCFMLVGGVAGSLIGGVLLLAAVSFCDDLRPLSARYRLLAQLAVTVWLTLALYQGRIFEGLLPYRMEQGLVVLAWLWFINLFNFMDGSDGLAASEAACIAAGFVVLGLFIPLPSFLNVLALVILGASLGFLLWNAAPARIFMGDVGSIPLGLVLGFMLLSLAAAGYLQAALILPAVFVADATLTLLRRLLKGERISEAHSSHAYQRAIRAGMGHGTVACNVSAVNLLLVLLAVASVLRAEAVWTWGCVVLAYALVLALLLLFTTHKAPPAEGDTTLPDSGKPA